MIQKKKFSQTIWFHLFLFVVTFITCTIAGAFWTTGTYEYESIDYYLKGLPYAAAILFILTTHEFGHYFASRFHKVNATFPYYIPFPPIPGILNFGTLGAVIRTKSAIRTNKAMFDVGAAGPIAGFIACLIVLIYGFTNLPGKEYILSIHPDYFDPAYGKDAISLEFGDTILFAFLREILTSDNQFVPPMTEMYHYPYLITGWFGLFVTAMNMIPVGQLDGGHITYSMFGGKKHFMVSSITAVIVLAMGILGFVDWYFDGQIGFGWTGWAVWAFILYYFIKIQHPPVAEFKNIDSGRMLIGYISYLIFILSFSPTPFSITM